MQTLLSELLTHAHPNTDIHDGIKKLACKLFNDSKISASEIEECLPVSSGQSPNEYISYLQSRLALLLVQKLHGVVGVKFPRLEKKCSGMPLVAIITALYDYFESGETNFHQSISLISASRGVLDGSIPDLMINLQLGVCTLILGIMIDSRELIEQGCDIAHFISHLFHPKTAAFIPIWVRECEYHLSEILSYSYLLFHLTSKVSSDDTFSELSSTLHGRLTKVDPATAEEIPPLMALLAAVIEPSLVEAPQVEFTPKLGDQLSLYVNQSEDRIEAITLTGVGSGLGGVLMGDIAILNFGPGQGYIGNADTFGIYKQEWNYSLKRQKEADFEKISGWTRLCGKDLVPQGSCCMTSLEMSSVWMELMVNSRKSSIDIEARFTALKEGKYSFLFFIRANKITVNENFHLLPDSLDRYDGNSQDILLQGVQSKLHVTYDGLTKMEIIPLAGRNFYWGADFMVAYQIEESDTKYRWKIDFNIN